MTEDKTDLFSQKLERQLYECFRKVRPINAYLRSCEKDMKKKK